VRGRFPAVRLLVSETNLGYAAANNLALRAAGLGGGPGRAHARHALLLNPDTVVPPGALAALVAALEAEPDVGVVGPKLLLPDGSLDLACRRSFPTPEVSFYRFSGLSRLFPGSPRFGRYNLTFLDPDRPADVDSVVGACMLVRGEAVDRVGLLDERFWMYGEDLDWALRIRRAGWRVVYRPAVVVHHVKRASSRKSPRARFEFQRAMWLFYEKHYAASTSRPVDALVRLAIALRGGRPLWREMRGRQAAAGGGA
jgi:GT2 family glycosyltransferase